LETLKNKSVKVSKVNAFSKADLCDDADAKSLILAVILPQKTLLVKY